MPPPEGDNEEKYGKEVKIITPGKLLTKLPVLLAQIKTGYNSLKLENTMRLTLYLLYQHNKITKKLKSKLIKSL